MFELDPRLAADTVTLSDLPLSRLLLMNDARYAWLILVPTMTGLSELHHLSPEDRAQLSAEIDMVSRGLEQAFTPTKINVGALGNIVRQLHVHIIARFEGDPAWPGPVWGHSTAVPYDDEQLEQTRERILGALGF